jgi:hypothetical protein
LKEKSMTMLFTPVALGSAFSANDAVWNSLPRHKTPDEAAEEDEEAQQLPVSPDEGTPVIPDDDERVLDVPS